MAMYGRSFPASFLAALGVLIGFEAQGQTTTAGDAVPDDTVVVRMLEASATHYVFEPAHVTVRQGQTLRFVQKGAVPHNVEIKQGPDRAHFADIRMGPFLISRNQVYEIRIDERFTRGTYDYVCTPHVMLGMIGKFTVEGRASPVEEVPRVLTEP